MDYSNFYSANANLMIPSPIRRMAHLTQKPGIISLAGGYPSIETFPMDIIRQLLEEAYSRRGAASFQYGLTRGNRELIEWLADFMKTRGVMTNPENILLTSGSQQALRLLADVLLSPGDVALVELPSYTGGIAALRNSGAELIGINQVDDGIVTEDLETTVIRLKAQRRRVKLLYTIPSFQNPSGITMSTAKRREVLTIARKHDFVIIEDDPYYELYFGDRPDTPTIKSLDNEGRVIYLSSFSKILTPGLRTAWVCADAGFLPKVEIAKEAADICSSTLDQEIVLGYCRGGHLARHVLNIRSFYYGRRNTLVQALRDSMPAGVTWTEPRGGFFAWVRLPEHIDTEAMLSASVDRGVAYIIGSPFHVNGAGKNTLRLAYSKEGPENLQKGVAILAELVSEWMKSPEARSGR